MEEDIPFVSPGKNTPSSSTKKRKGTPVSFHKPRTADPDCDSDRPPRAQLRWRVHRRDHHPAKENFALLAPVLKLTSSEKKRKGTPKVNIRALMAAEDDEDEITNEDERGSDASEEPHEMAVNMDAGAEGEIEDEYGEESFCSESDRESERASVLNQLRSSYRSVPWRLVPCPARATALKSLMNIHSSSWTNLPSRPWSPSPRGQLPLSQNTHASPSSSELTPLVTAQSGLSVNLGTSDNGPMDEDGGYTIEVGASIELQTPPQQSFRRDFLELAKGNGNGGMTVSGNILADSPPTGVDVYTEEERIVLLSRGDPRRPLSSKSRAERGETKPGH